MTMCNVTNCGGEYQPDGEGDGLEFQRCSRCTHERCIRTTQAPALAQPEIAMWDLVIIDMRARDLIGQLRYGRQLTADPAGRDPLQDAYEEALDLAVYLKQAIVGRNRT